jgi:hypothetical protein
MIAAPLSAQRLEQGRVAAHRAHQPMSADERHTMTNDVQSAIGEEANPPSIAAMFVAGTMLGAVGLFGGIALGAAFEDCAQSHDGFCDAGVIVGGLLGEGIALPIGVHLAGGRGSLSSEIGTSLGITLLGIAAAFVTRGPGILLVPPAQLIATIAMERNAKNVTQSR